MAVVHAAEPVPGTSLSQVSHNTLAIGMVEPGDQFKGFLKAIETLIEIKFTERNASAGPCAAPEVEALTRAITPFTHSPEQNVTFETWYNRFKTTFLEVGKNLTKSARVRLLLRRLDASAYARYANLLRPRDPAELPFEENIQRLTRLFGKGESLYGESACSIPWTNLRSGISDCTPDQFKALMFCISIRSDRHLFVRQQLLAKLETEKSEKINIDFLIDEAHRLSNVKKDAQLYIVPATV
ncbi:uncharacterized protein LOC129808569 [Phlebotomus papatasi]|uniref:uncharacterized protein LOC129808569 n=1 Tax=Phlebotomus papatasi TaxID=29031 RepID=UPI0024844581|nr:uncharacterized protein LOC129808569 [Phlebotomus papatasi]